MEGGDRKLEMIETPAKRAESSQSISSEKEAQFFDRCSVPLDFLTQSLYARCYHMISVASLYWFTAFPFLTILM